MRRAVTVSVLVALLAACNRGAPSRRPPIHLNPNMDRQQKYRPEAESRFFSNGTTMQAAIPGTVARGDLRENEEYFSGKNAFGYYAQNPMPATDTVIQRGRERFSIYCTPCHGDRADGKGMLFRRGGVKSRDLLDDVTREAPDGRIYEVITRGSGLMPAYRSLVDPSDRWAIVSYIRRLQAEKTRGGQ
jgi:mono/diheme cytochrome c family protein